MKDLTPILLIMKDLTPILLIMKDLTPILPYTTVSRLVKKYEAA
jgi:hypothetical protein